MMPISSNKEVYESGDTTFDTQLAAVQAESKPGFAFPHQFPARGAVNNETGERHGDSINFYWRQGIARENAGAVRETRTC